MDSNLMAVSAEATPEPDIAVTPRRSLNLFAAARAPSASPGSEPPSAEPLKPKPEFDMKAFLAKRIKVVTATEKEQECVAVSGLVTV